MLTIHYSAVLSMYHFRVLSTMAEGGADNKRFAENNGPFIRNALVDIRENTGMSALEFDYLLDSEDIPDKPGIYILCVDSGKKDVYPVYIGKTEKGIKTRLKEHKNQENGIIHRFGKEILSCKPFNSKKNQPRFRVWLLELETPCTMKFAESMFLMAFDFALNSAENSSTRRSISKIKVNSLAESYSMFKRVQDKLHSECAEIKVKSYSKTS